MPELPVKTPKYCRLCGGLCIRTGERTLRLCYSCAIRADTRKNSLKLKPKYGFRHV